MNYLISENDNVKKITFFVPDDPTRRVIKEKISNVLGIIGEEKSNSLYICIKELINYLTAVNILKLTAKFVNFDSKLSLLLNESYLTYFRERFKASGKAIAIVIKNVNDGVIIEIINSEPIPEEHEREIRAILRDLSSGKEFSLSLSGESYNFVSSIVMTWLILRDMGVDTSLFRIGNRDNKTFIRIEIPLSQSYISVRKSFERVQG